MGYYSDLDARLTEMGFERGSPAYHVVAKTLERWDRIETCIKEHGSECGLCPLDCVDADTEFCALRTNAVDKNVEGAT